MANSERSCPGICRRTPDGEDWGSERAGTAFPNRSTRYHRDLGSRYEWYDLLTSFGPYIQAPLYLSPLGLRINNYPGTVCAFSGMALRHAVRYTAHPRISVAFYLRENVRAGVHVKPAGWMSQSTYRNITGYSRFRR